MSLRTPRFKNEFLAIQNIKMDKSLHLLIKGDLSNHIDQALKEFLQTDSQYTFSILDFTQTYFEAAQQGGYPVVFDKDVGKKEVDEKATLLPYYVSAYQVKYFLENNDLEREEDFLFLAKLVKNSLVFTNNYSYAERLAIYETKTISHIHYASTYLSYGLSEYYMALGKIEALTKLDDKFRYFKNYLTDNKYDRNYNIFAGTQKIAYSSLRDLNRDEVFKYLYLYLYRLFDLTINKQITVNHCVVINGIRWLLDIRSYQTFYVTSEIAKQRLYKIENLLTELLEKGKEYGLNFILMDCTNEDFERLSPYCFTISSEVGGFKLDL
ncbi:hypothetical protein [Psittacicella hinzii]|uniref:hypothetical protein n=1 Tax=Psittacicella hinzii TaxID=2028575 RepID=UPI003614CB97